MSEEQYVAAIPWIGVAIALLVGVVVFIWSRRKDQRLKSLRAQRQPQDAPQPPTMA